MLVNHPDALPGVIVVPLRRPRKLQFTSAATLGSGEIVYSSREFETIRNAPRVVQPVFKSQEYPLELRSLKKNRSAD
jgi:hypothetical protein